MIKAIIDAIVLFLQQAGYIEKKVDAAQAAKQTPEAIYADKKEKMDEALVTKDIDTINRLANDVLPPPSSRDYSKQ